MNSSSFASRNKMLHQMQGKSYDLVVIGGGITGAGILRDAVMRGMKVALVEQSDFGSGTSSRSSKLVHGGLRYLENLEFDLVSEALHERQNLLDMVPHMVRPLRFLMPIYEGDRVGLLKMGAGMALYDSLSAVESTHLHEVISTEEIKARYSSLKSEGLKGGFLYSDALMDDDRLVYETLRSALNEGAEAVSYVKATAYEEGRLLCKDLLSSEELILSAKHVISAVGPWTDELGEALSQKSWKKRMRPSKGIHITLPKHILNLDSAVVMAADAQKRILFCIPREGFDIIGTTDTDYEGDFGEVYADQKDVEYVFRILREYFPNVEISQEDVISTYAGIRPLVNDGSASESKVSRDHWVHTDLKNRVTYIAGGKYTTYLSMAEHCVDVVLEEAFSVDEVAQFKKANTRVPFVSVNRKENEAQAWEKISKLKLDLSKQERKEFFYRHGVQSLFFLKEFWRRGVSLAQLEALVAIHYYFCGSISDFFSRRVPYILSMKDGGNSLIEEVAAVFKEELSLTDETLKKQIEDHQKDLLERRRGLT